MCNDTLLLNVYRIMANDQVVTGFIYAKDETAFLGRHPEAVLVGAQYCDCKEERRVERLFGYAGIPKHREHCTWEYLDSVAETVQEGKLEAREIAYEFAKQGTFPYPHTGGLLLVGQTGRGKSSLAACVARERISAGVQVMWIDLNEFLTEVYRAQEVMFGREQGQDDGPTNPFQFVETVAKAPFLIIDDFGDLKRSKSVTDFQRDKIYDVIRSRYEHELPCVITTNLSYAQMLEQFGPRITDRLMESWQWVEMSGKNLRMQDGE